MIKKMMLFLLLGLIISCSNNDDDNNREDKIEEINFTGPIEGCSDFGVTKLLSFENLNTALSINGTGRETLNLTSDFSEFEVPNNNITIEISEWDDSVSDFFCNDTPFLTPNKIKSFNAISGKIKIKITDIQETEFETYYRLTILLENIILENDEGQQKSISNLIIENVGVGWLPG